MASGPAADNETWEKCKIEGEFLCAFMKADDEAAGKRLKPPQDSAASRFNNFPELPSTWGWWQDRDDKKTTFTEGGYGLKWAFEHLRISKEKEDWMLYKVVHGGQRENASKSYEQSYNVLGKPYRVGISTNIQQNQATEAYYTVPINVKNGVIIVAKQYSPAFKAANRIPLIIELSELRYSSDIVWGLWKEQANLHAREPGTSAQIRHIITFDIDNELTKSIINRALKELGLYDDLGWPGFKFSMDSDGAKAILGSPDGLGIGYLLGQHKKELGNMEVKFIRIFQSDISSDNKEFWCIYWSLGAV